MEVRTKLRVCVILSAIALIFKIIAMASPGWTVVKTHVFFNQMDDLTPEEDGLHVDEIMEMEKEEAQQKVSISFGLWYYRVCKCGKHGDSSESSSEEDSHEVQTPAPEDAMIHDEDRKHRRHHRRHHGKCYFRCYRKNKHHKKHHDKDLMVDEVEEVEKEYEDVPKEFAPAKDFIVTAVDIARHARHELAWYAAVGLALGVVGMIGTVVFARGGGMGKHSGRLACSTQVLSAFFFWMAIIRVASYMIQLKKGSDLVDYGYQAVDFECPWCLWVAAIGATMMGLASLFHLIMVSRDKKHKPSEYILHSDKVPIIAPRGYEELVVPPMYEEAGPLPEKKVIQ